MMMMRLKTIPNHFQTKMFGPLIEKKSEKKGYLACIIFMIHSFILMNSVFLYFVAL